MIQRAAVCAILVVGAISVSHAQSPAASPSTHIMLTEPQIKWGDPPPALPKGAMVAVLSGDPSQAGPFTMRAKFPAGYKIAAHWHPTDEHLTVLAGTFSAGTGDAFDMKGLHEMPVGTFAVMPAEMRHFAYTKGGATIQIHGMGPFVLTYVNPADDPRKAAPATN
jgi:quercetin dioxygenase-like cupin family protein